MAGREHRSPLIAVLVLALSSVACGILPGSSDGGELDGPVGHGSAELANESDADLRITLGLPNGEPIEIDVAAGETRPLTPLSGGFGVNPMICQETAGLRVERVSDSAVVVDHASCDTVGWSSQSVGEYEVLFTTTVTQAMVDAALVPSP